MATESIKYLSPDTDNKTETKVFPRPDQHAKGIVNWLTTIDHKKIGIMYGVSALFFLLLGGLEALLIRSQLWSHNMEVLTNREYNQMFTMHGTTMVFLVIMPLSAAFFNFIMPLQIGARDVAFPRMNTLSFDRSTDVAVLKIESSEPLPFVSIADSDNLDVGDIVFAAGNPLGIGMTVTMGIISATKRSELGVLDQEGSYENFIQTDASINRGNSGGALLDTKGRLIGINTAIISQTGSSIGIGLAIPVNMVRKVLTDLVEKGGVMRGFLGVELQASSFGEPGAIVGAIVPGSAADLASIKSGDRIIKVGEKFVDSVNQSRLAISQTTPGTRLPIELIRDGKRLTVFVTLDLLGGVKRISIPGISLEPLTSENRLKFQIPAKTKGVIVTQSTGEAKTFKEGVVIVEVNGYQVNSVRELEENIRKGSNRLYVWYRDKYRFLSYRVP